MNAMKDARFWDRTSRKYASSRIDDQEGYQRSLTRTRAFLKPANKVLELGCGTGTSAMQLADGVQSYLATDISAEMIAIAEDKNAANPITGLSFRVALAETLSPDSMRFDAILGFNYIHLVRDVPAVLRRIHDLLPEGGLFISKTPCVGDMNPLIRHIMLPAMRAVGKAPHVTVFGERELGEYMNAAGFDILAKEIHATRRKDTRPFIVARKKPTTTA